MAEDRSYIEVNTRERERLRAFIERVDDAALAAPANEYWTVAGVLGHLAYWDSRVLVFAEKIDRGEPWVPSDEEPEGDGSPTPPVRSSMRSSRDGLRSSLWRSPRMSIAASRNSPSTGWHPRPRQSYLARARRPPRRTSRRARGGVAGARLTPPVHRRFSMYVLPSIDERRWKDVDIDRHSARASGPDTRCGLRADRPPEDVDRPRRRQQRPSSRHSRIRPGSGWSTSSRAQKNRCAYVT